MLRKLITAAAVAAVLGFAVPAAQAASAHAQKPATTCPGGYATWNIHDQDFSFELFLLGNGQGNPLSVSDENAECWHAPGGSNYGYFQNTVGNCIDWDNAYGEFIVANGGCDGAASEKFKAVPDSGGAYFVNLYGYNNLSSDIMWADCAMDGCGVQMASTLNVQDIWYG